MNFSERAKFWYWLALVVIGTGFISIRGFSGDAAFPTPVDAAVAVVWGVLCLVPLFSEITLGGFSVKREVSELKTELKSELREQILNIRSDLTTITQIHTAQSQNISFVNAPQDSQLPDLEERIRAAIRDELGPNAVPAPPAPLAQVPDSSQLLFSVRFLLEREIRRLAAPLMRRSRARPASQLIQMLVSSETISNHLASGIREVYSVCSIAVHGEEPSRDQIAFVEDVGPQLIATLRTLEPIDEPLGVKTALYSA